MPGVGSRGVARVLRISCRALDPHPQFELIESSVVIVRHGTDRTQGCLTRDGMLAMIYKLGLCAERSWRRLRGSEWLAKIVDGVKVHDGVEVQNVVRSY